MENLVSENPISVELNLVNVRLVLKKDRLQNFDDDDSSSLNTLKEREGISELYKNPLGKPKGYNIVVEKGKAGEIFDMDPSTQRLKVPEFLSDIIETAYIPTEPQYFYATPPNPIDTDFDFLTLDDITKFYAPAGQVLTGKGIRIAMPDSGFYPHPFFSNRFKINRYAVSVNANPEQDDDGHGTGESANIFAIAPDCIFLGVKRAHAAESLEYCISLKPKILVCSWGWDIDDSSFEDLKKDNRSLYEEIKEVEGIINEAIEDGIIVVFAAGNGAKAFPASMREVISVGGVKFDKNGINFNPCDSSSNFTSTLYPGRKVPDVSGICGSRDGNWHIVLPVPRGSQRDGRRFRNNQTNVGWGIFSGTSAAAPQIAAVVALILSIIPNASQKLIKEILQKSSTRVSGINELPEQLLVNVQEACKWAQGYNTRNRIVKKKSSTKKGIKNKISFLRRKSK